MLQNAGTNSGGHVHRRLFVLSRNSLSLYDACHAACKKAQASRQARPSFYVSSSLATTFYYTLVGAFTLLAKKRKQRAAGISSAIPRFNPKGRKQPH